MPKLRKSAKLKTEPEFELGSGNIFVDLGFTEDEAVSLLARSELAMEIRNIIEKKGWTQHQAAKEMGVVQPRIAEIMKMRLEHYSVEKLLKYLNKLGRRVSFVIEKKSRAA